MLTVALIFLIVVLIWGYSWCQDERERELTKRLERMREKGLPASLVVSTVDTRIAQSRRDAEFLSEVRDKW